ncbi:MAG: DUF58 domain-containing protein [Candidatus Thermoplasmatota archaeon]|nr:DUF58 domain-containing protein [Candidatus Thermoplasmatota archaeon]
MKSTTNLVLVAVTLISLIIGVVLDNWVFLILSIANFSLLAVGTKGSVKRDIELRVERKSEKINVYEGNEIWIELSIRNEGRALKYLEIYDELPSGAEVVEGSNHHLLKIDEKEEKTVRYKLFCPKRGKIEVGPIRLRYRDPLDLYVEEWTSQKMLELFVLPSIQDLEGVNIRPLYTRSWIGNVRSQNMGIGSEFFSLGEYSPGDEMKKINWKATARHQEPITNEFVAERSGDVIIVVDASRQSNIGTSETNTIDASIEAAGSLASSILADRNRAGLIVLGDYLKWVYPDSGRYQFYKMMEKLSTVEKGEVWELKDAEWLLNRFFPERSMVVFISPLQSEKITETIVDICMREFNVMVISPDPLEIEKELLDEYSSLEEQLSQLERDILLDRLWRYSLVVDWDPNEPLKASLEEVIRYWEKR